MAGWQRSESVGDGICSWLECVRVWKCWERGNVGWVDSARKIETREMWSDDEARQRWAACVAGVSQEREMAGRGLASVVDGEGVCRRGSAVSCWHYSWFPWWRRYLALPLLLSLSDPSIAMTMLDHVLCFPVSLVSSIYTYIHCTVVWYIRITTYTMYAAVIYTNAYIYNGVLGMRGQVEPAMWDPDMAHWRNPEILQELVLHAPTCPSSIVLFAYTWI